LGVVAVIGIIIGETAISVSHEGEYLLDLLTAKMQAIFLWLATTFNFEPDITDLFDNALEYVNIGSVSSAVSGIAIGVGNITGSFVMFGLFFVMLLGGLKYYKRYIYFIAGNPEKGARWLIEYEKIYVKIIRYLSTKTYVSLTTGLLVFFVCIIFDVRFPAFWGFLTFIFNFIPSIGSIVATIFIALFYIIQCETVGDFALFTGLLISVHFLIGNVVEPKIMSNRLSLNTPTVLFGLFFWGFLWGPVGMMLSVPLFVMIRIILEDIPSLAFLGRMMGSSSETNPKKKKHKKDKVLEDKEISEKEEI
jgi:predicted PurR-regulated permease PerM